MMLTRLSLAVVVCVGLLVSCSMPTGTTVSKNENPGLLVAGAPAGAVLIVDGIDMGQARQYAGNTALPVVPGRHVVEVRSGNVVIYREEVYVGASVIRTVHVPREDSR